MSQTAGKIQVEVDKLTNDLNLLADRILKLISILTWQEKI